MVEFTTKGTGAIKFNDLAYPTTSINIISNGSGPQAAPNAYHLTTENTTFSAPTNAVEGAFICVEINYNGAQSHVILFLNLRHQLHQQQLQQMAKLIY